MEEKHSCNDNDGVFEDNNKFCRHVTVGCLGFKVEAGDGAVAFKCSRSPRNSNCVAFDLF